MTLLMGDVGPSQWVVPGHWLVVDMRMRSTLTMSSQSTAHTIWNDCLQAERGKADYATCPSCSM